jgi:hypothetical protein
MSPKPTQMGLLPLPRTFEDYSKIAHYLAIPTNVIALLSRSVSNIPQTKHLSFLFAYRFAND